MRQAHVPEDKEEEVLIVIPHTLLTALIGVQGLKWQEEVIINVLPSLQTDSSSLSTDRKEKKVTDIFPNFSSFFVSSQQKQNLHLFFGFKATL